MTSQYHAKFEEARVKGQQSPGRSKKMRNWWSQYRRNKPADTGYCTRCGREMPLDQLNKVYDRHYKEYFLRCDGCTE
jgi:hypothetical protein